MTCGIYTIIHIHSGRQYVGSSHNIKSRWYTHRRLLMANEHHSRYLQRVWNKYGEDAFEFKILELIDFSEGFKTFTVEQKKHFKNEFLLSKEQVYLDTLKPVFNGNPTAGSRLGSKASEETKRKQSEALKGKSPSESIRNKISVTLKGHKVSEKAKLHLFQTGHKNEPWNKGKTKKDNSILEKMSKVMLGTKLSEETKQKLSEAHKGKKFSEETKRKMSEAHKAIQKVKNEAVR